MKLLFAHSCRFISVNGNYYSNQFSDSVLQRYFDLTPNITIVARIEKRTEVPKGESRITLPIKIHHVHILNLSDMEVYIENSDYVIGRIPSIQGSAAIYYALKHNKPNLVEVVGSGWDAYWNHSIKGKLAAIPIDMLNKWAVKHADYALYVTQKYLQICYPSKGITLGCSDVIVKPQETLPRIRLSRLNTDLNPLKIGSVGNCNTSYKNFDKIIKALGILSKKGYKNIFCEFTGGGNRQHLIDLATKLGVLDQVVFNGSIAHEKMESWYNSLDIYLQVSSQEGLPRSVVEAMTTGCACIVTNVSDMPFMVDQDFFVVNKNNIPNELSERLLKIIDNPQIVKQASIKNFQYSHNYSYDKLLALRTHFYNQFISKVSK